MSEREKLSEEELDEQSAEHLPDREAMSIVDLGDPGTFMAAPVPVDGASADDEIFPVTEPPGDPATPPF